jgi:hypothetical protein
MQPCSQRKCRLTSEIGAPVAPPSFPEKTHLLPVAWVKCARSQSLNPYPEKAHLTCNRRKAELPMARQCQYPVGSAPEEAHL